MNWISLHKESEELALDAHQAIETDPELAYSLFVQAGVKEKMALESLDAREKPRTYSVTAVSATALFYKGKDLVQAEALAHEYLAKGNLLEFAANQLLDILQEIWREKNHGYINHGYISELQNQTGFTPARQQPSDDGFSEDYGIPDSLDQLKEDAKIQAAKEMQGFLKYVQKHTGSQLCSLFLIDDDGYLKSQCFYGFDSTGKEIKDKFFSDERYPDDYYKSAVARTIKPDESSRYGKSLLLTKDDLEEESFINQDNKRRIEKVCGTLTSVILTPVNGPNRSYGVLRIIKTENHERFKATSEFDRSCCGYLESAVSVLATNLKDVNSSQKNALMLYMGRANDEIHAAKLSQNNTNSKIYDYLKGIIDYLAHSHESCVKAATLRLFSQSRQGLITVVSSTQQPGEKKDISIRRVSDFQNKLRPVVLRVYELGSDCTITDLQEEIGRGDQVRYNWQNKDWLRNSRFKSMLCLAIKINQKTVGTISLYTGHKQVIANKDRVHFRIIADSISLYLAIAFSNYQNPGAGLDRFLESLEYVKYNDAGPKRDINPGARMP